MKFIFPQNYVFKNKLFGIIDYSTLILNIVWDLFVFCFLDLILKNWSAKISCLIVFCFPLLLFSIIGFNHENFISVLIYLFKYIKNPKLHLYNKNT